MIVYFATPKDKDKAEGAHAPSEIALRYYGTRFSYCKHLTGRDAVVLGVGICRVHTYHCTVHTVRVGSEPAEVEPGHQCPTWDDHRLDSAEAVGRLST